MTLRLMLAMFAAGPTALVAAISYALVRRRDTRVSVRLRVEPYRADRGRADALVGALDTMHRLLLRDWRRRLLDGSRSVALELHVSGDWCAPHASLAIVVPSESSAIAEAALRGAYPNAAVRAEVADAPRCSALMRLRKRRAFIERLAVIELDTLEHPPVDRLLTVMAAAIRAAPGATAQSPADCAAFVQFALTPAPAWFERLARQLHERREHGRSREPAPPSQVAQAELEGGLYLQHRPLFFGDVRVGGPDGLTCERIAAELCASGAENRLVPRVGGHRRRVSASTARRIVRGQGAARRSPWRGVYASNEIAALWHFPSVGFCAVPFARRSLPVAPAPHAILRAPAGAGLLRDEVGPVTLHPDLRRQNMAVVGTVEQGKSSLLVASVHADLQRRRCAVILLDPKGDAADAALSAVPEDRDCTLLDLRSPTCGFNPLAVTAPPDTVADFVVAALRQLFGEGDIRGSSDRYLRNAIIAVLAGDSGATLWDVARILSVGDDGRAYRAWIARQLLGKPEYAEVATFFGDELATQLSDARAATTAKLDAPANKLARLLNSASIKRVLLNESLRVDFDRVIERGEVLVVRGALGEIGAANVSVLMQLITGALDAGLARQQDRQSLHERTAVALKIDEAPLVINEAFAQTLALKRSAGLETVACWQTDAQWSPELRAQLDALFAHRVYFATAAATDARDAARALLDEYTDQLRPEARPGLAAPDVRLHLPPHFAIASWVTPEGRQQPFIGETLPYDVDPSRLAFHAERQHRRGARKLTTFAQPHWQQLPSPKEPATESRTKEAPARRTPSEGSRRREGASAEPPQTYTELLTLDKCSRARLVPPPAEATPLYPDALDLEVLTWLSTAGWALTTQIHRRFNVGKALTTTQRRLKRLADAEALQRVQLHAADGGGAPMCCSLGRNAAAVLENRQPRRQTEFLDVDGPSSAESLRALSAHVHVVAWLLALEAAAGSALVSLRGPRRMRLRPPEEGGRAIGPADLRPPHSRTPRDFFRTGATTAPVEEFEAVTPLAAIETAVADGSKAQLLLDVAPSDSRALVTLLERYDHMVSGWWSATHAAEPPHVVIVCTDAESALHAAQIADTTLTASLAYAGEEPRAWPRPGRERIHLVAEADLHRGSLRAMRAPALPQPARTAGDSDAPREANLLELPLPMPDDPPARPLPWS